jgi:hypothetical protein
MTVQYQNFAWIPYFQNDMINSYKIMVGDTEEKKSFERPRSRR